MKQNIVKKVTNNESRAVVTKKKTQKHVINLKLTKENKPVEMKKNIKEILKQSAYGLLLDCSSKNITIKTPKEAFELLPKDISWFKIKGINLSKQRFSSLKDLILTLTIINISNCSLTTLKSIEICRNLQFLNANNNKIQLLINLINLEYLEELYVAYNPLKNLKDVVKMKALVIIDISGCVKQVSDLRILSQSKSLKAIRVKDLELKDKKCLEMDIKEICPNITYIDCVYSLSSFKEIPEFILSDEEYKNCFRRRKRENSRCSSISQNRSINDSTIINNPYTNAREYIKLNINQSKKCNKHCLTSSFSRIISYQKEVKSRNSVKSSIKKNREKSLDTVFSLTYGNSFTLIR